MKNHHNPFWESHFQRALQIGALLPVGLLGSSISKRLLIYKLVCAFCKYFHVMLGNGWLPSGWKESFTANARFDTAGHSIREGIEIVELVIIISYTERYMHTRKYKAILNIRHFQTQLSNRKERKLCGYHYQNKIFSLWSCCILSFPSHLAFALSEIYFMQSWCIECSSCISSAFEFALLSLSFLFTFFFFLPQYNQFRKTLYVEKLL